MAEQRLIDATSLKVLFEHEYRHNKQFKQSSVWMAWQGAIQLLYDQPTIDPEMLPIVRQLREELARVTAERDVAVKDLRGCAIESYAECMYCRYKTARSFCWDCTDGSNWAYRDPQKEE